MFWARARRLYGHVTSDDPDVKKFLQLSNEFQKDVYGGLSGWIQDIGHKWISRKTCEAEGKVLEIGFGAGRHNQFYSGERKNYFVSEYSDAHRGSDIWNSIKGMALRCDACALPFPSESFQTVISIYNLEHISDLDAVFHEVHRVLKRAGRFLVALPCEGGLAWNIGRELTSRRLFKNKYKINYDKVIAYEHVWSFEQIHDRLSQSGQFRIEKMDFFPTIFPSINLNLIGCIECIKS